MLAAALAVAPLPPAVRVEVAPGRSIALRCAGSGPHTVLFDAGGSDWSPVWALVQPAIAARARACSYDRAGLGSSDPAQGPRSPAAIAEDMHALIGAAGLGKVVLVGHSLGGFNAKLTAALYPADVAGLVLLDPSEERSWDRSRGPLAQKYGADVAARAELTDLTFMATLAAHYRRCADRAADKGTLDLADPAWKRCADPDRPALGEALNAERRRVHATAPYQAAQAAEIEASVYADDRADPVYAMLLRDGAFGTMPMTVLHHLDPPSDDPVDRLNAEQGVMLHRQTAALSRGGRFQPVADSGHYLQLDQPRTVIAAILDVMPRAWPSSPVAEVPPGD